MSATWAFKEATSFANFFFLFFCLSLGMVFSFSFSFANLFAYEFYFSKSMLVMMFDYFVIFGFTDYTWLHMNFFFFLINICCGVWLFLLSLNCLNLLIIHVCIRILFFKINICCSIWFYSLSFDSLNSLIIIHVCIWILFLKSMFVSWNWNRNH